MVGDGRCTFGTRMPLDIHMLNEMIHREQKHFRNYRTYTPNFGSIPVTGKFYARHDQLPDDQTDADGGAEAARRGEEYCERVAQARALGPRARCDYPATENQVSVLRLVPGPHLPAGPRRPTLLPSAAGERPHQGGRRHPDLQPEGQEAGGLVPEHGSTL
ncbi:uncharacterized protein LOC105393821 isoform X1 [Plutella xylostella]|uniref:uncharacterized protein LOC105393821 isoform X1 n=1 Tax=Plutella xylostella TaxID=51655 RepID=UPI002032F58C|nr:uncharacterized protein LOC105393821 isoform X1 [Plutella xylostella]